MLGNFFTEKGIVHQSSCNNTPQQIGWLKEKTNICLKLLELQVLQLSFKVSLGRSNFNSHVLDQQNAYKNFKI